VAIYGFEIKLYRLPLYVENLLISETLFHLFVYIPSSCYLQRGAIHHPRLPSEERYELFDLCNENIFNPEEYLHKWFLGAGLQDMKRENVKEFYLWGYFNRGGPPGDDNEELEEYANATEELLGVSIEEGWGKAKSFRLTIDKVWVDHRSLTFYLVRLYAESIVFNSGE
jgi:hypothetical protein